MLSKVLNKKFYCLEVEEYNLESLNNKIESIYTSLISLEDFTEIYKYLPELETGLYTESEYDYICKSILNKIVKQLIENQQELSKKETYQDRELSNLFVSDFLTLEKLYNCIKDVYLKVKQKEIDVIETDTIEKIPINNIFLASNSTKSYIEKDIHNLPEETLYEIMRLIDAFKYDGLRKNECGRFYVNCAKRSIDLYISTEEKYLLECKNAEETYNKIMNYVEEKKRK